MFLLLFPQIIISQVFTVEDVEINIHTKFKTGHLSNIRWNTDSSIIFTDNDSLFEYNMYYDQKEYQCSLDDLNKAVEDYGLLPLNHFPSLKLASADEFYMILDSIILVYDLPNRQIRSTIPLDGNAENINYCEKYRKAAFTVKGNLYIADDEHKIRQITFDSIDGIVNGEIVHRNEFGIEEGSFWSPDGSMLAFYHKDETTVTKYPHIDFQSRIADAHWIRYPMAGMKSEKVELYVYSLTNNSFIRINAKGDPEQYLTNITWSPDSKYIYIQQLNRGQDTLRMVQYETTGGEETAVLFSEINKKYVEPQSKIIFDATHKRSFLYQSSRDGYNHLYLYDADKEKLVQLTSGEWEVLEYKGFDSKHNELFFTATEKSVLESHLYKLNIRTKQMERLTQADGMHTVVMNKKKNAFVDYYSSYNIPRIIQVSTVDHSIRKSLIDADNKFGDYDMGEVTISKIKSADGETDLYYRLIKPVNFEPDKKYPVIIYVYGGPHLQLITNSWMGRTEMWQQYMAQRGYIGFVIDPRGSENRGLEFENAVYRKLGIPQLEDYKAAIDFLSTYDYVDMSRIGVHGWSFGGYMTISLLVNYPEIFKVGVAGGPVIDWKFYEVMYTERYMDTPNENPEGYELTNLNNSIHNLKGKLLIIQGGQDPIVVPQHCMSFIQNCIENKKQVDFFIYPTHEHNVIGFDRVHLTTKISDYFLENL